MIKHFLGGGCLFNYQQHRGRIVQTGDRYFTPSNSDYAERFKQVVSRQIQNMESLIERMEFLIPMISKAEAANVDRKMKNRIFIGHGRSQDWIILRNFISDRLRLPFDEFNREPTAGLTTQERLSGMLDSAGFAFLIMTAEDEREDGILQARMNVIHEVGLFQGRLGFRKAIILLEKGCEEFSNIIGTGQIRFSPGNIVESFEEIRRVLEREGILLQQPPAG